MQAVWSFPPALYTDQRHTHNRMCVTETPNIPCTPMCTPICTPRPPVQPGNKQVAVFAAQPDLFPLSSKEFINFSPFMWNLQSLLEEISIATVVSI